MYVILKKVTKINIENKHNILISECNCNQCITACKYRTCWGSPEDIELLIEKGYGNRLMLDWYNSDEDIQSSDDNSNIYVLVPAIIDYELKQAPFDPRGTCNFLKDDLCEIHKIKPIEGKLASHDNYSIMGDVHIEIVKLWNSEKGRSLIKKWKKKFKIGD